MSRSWLRRSLCFGCATGALFAPQLLQAARAADAAPPGGVETIVVTAEKRVENIQQIPAAVTAVTAERLTNQNANNFQDYFREIPSLAVTGGSQGTNQVSIRGINSSAFTGPTVGIYVDDTPIGTSVAGDHANQLVPDLDPSDLQRIEVLRGPQGTLYGAAAIGGILRFVTAAPSLDEASGRAEVDVNSVDYGGVGYVLRGAFTAPLVQDQIGLRISGYLRDDPGYIRDPGFIDNPDTDQNLSQRSRSDINKTRVYGGHGSVLWQLSSDISLKLSALYQYHRGDAQAAEDINGLTQRPLHGDLTQIDSQFTGQNSNSLQVYNGEFTWSLPWATLLSSTSYAKNNYKSVTDITGLVPPAPTSGFPPQGLPYPIPAIFFPNAGAGYFTYPLLPPSYYSPVSLAYSTGKTTEELRLTSPSSQQLEWQLGFFFTHETTTGTQEIDLDNPATGAKYPITGICAPPFPVSFPPLPPDFFPACTAIDIPAPAGTPFHHSVGKDDYTEYAGYADATYHLTDAFSIEAGLRYSSNHQRFLNTFNGVLDALSNGPPFAGGNKGSFSGTDLTWLVSPKYQISDDVMVYARFASGYRPGGSNGGLIAAPATFGPDTVTNYEVGLKSTLFDQKVIFNTAAFLIDWDNVQLQTINPQDEGYFINGKTARSDGIEAEITATPADGLVVQASGSYNHAVLTADIPAVAGTFGFNGDRLPYSAEFSGDLSADYSWPLMTNVIGRVGGDLQYVGDEVTDFDPCTPNTSQCSTPGSLPPPRSVLPAYTVLNLRAGFTYDAWDVNLFVKNLADKRAFVGESVQHATFGLAVNNGRLIPDSATPILPRTIGISIARTF